MKKLAIVTSTRADYGLLYPVIKRFRELEGADFRLLLLVTGTHLEEAFGNTVEEIESDGFRIDFKVKTRIVTQKDIDIAEIIADTIREFTRILSEEKPDGIMLLGDRYEMLGVATAANVARVPILHISGGDTTEGAMDENIRHAITKLASVHFTTNEESRRRVLQMGEESWRVHNTGSTSIDNIAEEKLLTKKEALSDIGLSEELVGKGYIICTYHPVTLSESDAVSEAEILAEVLEEFADEGYFIIITKANADSGGSRINAYWDGLAEKKGRFRVFSSLGRVRYLSLVKYAAAVAGNSSSGIVEVPALGVPAVDVGDRQRGRTRGNAVFHAELEKEAIYAALKLALSEEGRAAAKNGDNPYGVGKSAEKIVKLTMEHLEEGISISKKFQIYGREGL